MALLTLSVKIYACCNHSAPTAGASTPRSCFLLPDEPMVYTNLSLEGKELNAEKFKGIADDSEKLSITKRWKFIFDVAQK